MTGAVAKLADRYRTRKIEDLRRIDGLMESAQAGDRAAIDELAAIAHGLGGVCGVFGEPALGGLANAAEDVARAHDASPADLIGAVTRLQAGLAESLA